MLAPGECIVAFTDGVTEADSPHGQQLGRAGVTDALRGAGGQTANHTVKLLTEAVSRFRGSGPQADDVTVLAIRLLAGPAEKWQDVFSLRID